ncbi:MAG: amidohydrolase family protein [Gemmatimonadales bacterium]
MMYSCAPAARGGSSAVVKKKGKSLRVDIHCHYLNAEVAARVGATPPEADYLVKFSNAQTRETNQKQGKERGPKLTDIAVRLKDMDRMGIDIQAVSPAPHQTYYWTDPGMGQELARAVNERLAEIGAQHPERFVPMGTVPLQDASLALSELEHCVKRLGMRGVEINPSVRGMDLTDEQLGLEKFFAKAQELDVVLFMHPIGFTHGERLSEHYFNNVIGNPLDSTVAVSHLIFDGTMARHPKLKVLVAHGGGFVAHYWARMDHAWRARPDCRTVIKRPPSKYLEKFFFDTITHDPQMLKHLVDRFGADHVVLGTDYPYDMGDDDPLGLLAQVKRLPKAERDLIAGGNAARLLKLK